MKRLIVLISCCFMLAACTPPSRTAVQRIPFPSEEYSKLAKTGTATIKGQAFLKTRGGDVKTAAGEEVLLNPVTSYSQQWYEVNYLQGNLITEVDPRAWEYIKKKTADAEGRFTFENVPAGDYFLVATVIWEAPVGYAGAMVPQGGIVAKRISVKEDEKLDLILTR